MSDWSSFEAVFGAEGEAGRRIRLAILMFSGIIVVGTTGYIALGWSFIDALYMTVITVGTIGFEEVRNLDESVAGRLWTITLIISGVAVLGYATTSLVALAVEGTVRDYFRSRRMRAEISKLNGLTSCAATAAWGGRWPRSSPWTVCRS